MRFIACWKLLMVRTGRFDQKQSKDWSQMVSVYGTVHFDKGMTEIMMGIWAAPLWATPSHSSALHVRKWALLILASYPSALLSVFLIYYVKARKGSSLQAAEEPGETATSNTQQHLGLCKHWKTILVGPPGLHSNSLNRLWPASLYVAPQLSIVVKTQNFGWPSYFKKKKKKCYSSVTCSEKKPQPSHLPCVLSNASWFCPEEAEKCK